MFILQIWREYRSRIFLVNYNYGKLENTEFDGAAMLVDLLGKQFLPENGNCGFIERTNLSLKGGQPV